MAVRLLLRRAGEELGDAGEVLGLPGNYRPGVNVLAFIIEGGVMSHNELPAVVEEARRLAQRVDASKPVVVTGRGPLWLYGALVSVLRDAAPAVATYEPRARVGIVVHGDRLGEGVSLDGSPAEPSIPGASRNPGDIAVKHAPLSDKYLVHVEPKTRFLHPSLLPHIVSTLPQSSSKLVVVEGPMAVWMASAIVARLVGRAPAVALYDPRLGGGVVVHAVVDRHRVGEVVPVGREEIALVAGRHNPRVIGVVGDPNSGKSVFIQLLANELRRRGRLVLNQEADMVAPTQEWSMYAPEIRKMLKKHMEPAERLKWFAESVKRVRETGSVDYMILDLGGGRPDLGVRVTDENKLLLSMVDYVIVVSRNDSGNIAKWLREMAEKTPNVKIVAVIESRLSGAPRYVRGRPVRGVAVGLDRRKYAERRIPLGTAAVVRAVADAVERAEAYAVRASEASRTGRRESLSV